MDAFFRPIRSSTPPRSRTTAGGTTTLVPPAAPSDVSASRSSIQSTSDLAGLSPADVAFIDAVIARAPANSTTFLSLFKAYDAELSARGLRSEDEVDYYSKLLKIGTLKGTSWDEKWRSVKAQYGYKTASATNPAKMPSKTTTGIARLKTTNTAAAPTPSERPGAARLLQRLRMMQHGADVESSDSPAMPPRGVFSQTDVTEPSETESQLDRRSPTPSQTGTNDSTDAYYMANHPPPPPRGGRRGMMDEESEADSTPPSYHTHANGVRDHKVHVATPVPAYRTPVSRPILPASLRTPIPYAHTPVPSRAPVPAPSTRPPVHSARTPALSSSSRAPVPAPRAPVLPSHAQNRRPPEPEPAEDDAWKKIKMEQDEEIADQFFEDRLVERCWHVWKEGYDWTVTTSAQIDQARNTLVLRRALERWRARLTRLRQLEAQVSTHATQKLARRAFETWHGAFQRRAQERWRTEMRDKMRAVKDAREAKLMKDAWAKWRQLFRSHLSQQQYDARLRARVFQAWRVRLARVDEMEEGADAFEVRREGRVVRRAWEVWKEGRVMREKERVVVRMVGARIKRQAMETWKTKMTSLDTADAFRDAQILKRTLARWKKARDHVRALERRADKHLARSDEILLIAITRIWRAKERGQLLERVRAMRILKHAWRVWRSRIDATRTMEAKAAAFATRSDSRAAVDAMQKWRARTAETHAATAFAAQYHAAQLRYRTLYIWRLQLRAQLKVARAARVADKFFVARRAWVVWRAAIAERVRERRLEGWERERRARVWKVWREKAERGRRLRAVEEEVVCRVKTRIMKDALNTWMIRVVAVKDRELLVAQKNDRAILTKAMTKWKAVCIRHVEELNLMESYQAVKREESMRRMFYTWLNAARAASRRRQALQEAEEEFRRQRLAAAWDTWRGRFETERLLPLERTFVMQGKHALMYKAFVTWHSKTRSLPAVRFHAATLKSKHWAKWRAAMPRALQAKTARDFDKKTVLSHAYAKWLQALRTKRALRAVARARNMNLATTSSKPSFTRALPPPSTARSVFPRAAPRHTLPEPETEVETDKDEKPARTRSRSPLRPGRTSIANLLSSRPKTDAIPSSRARPTVSSAAARGAGVRDPSPVRSRVSRDESPPRSIASQPVGPLTSRPSLWSELQDIRRKSRTPGPTERPRASGFS